MAGNSSRERNTTTQQPLEMHFVLVDGSKTHLTLQGLQKMNDWGVEVVVFPPHLTDVIQPLDKAVFRAVKAPFHKKEEHWKRKNHHRAPSPADFVELWTDAYVDAVTPRNIRDAGSNSHEFARIRIRPELAGIRDHSELEFATSNSNPP